MSWEPVDALPGETSDGAFRGAAEPVVAERRGRPLLERLRLFWHATPELPARRVPEQIVVSPHHVYVERADGSRARLALERLRGQRLERGRVVYGVEEGEPLVLPHRPRCPVEARLAAVIRGSETLAPWHQSQGVVACGVLSALVAAGAVALNLEDGPSAAWQHVAAGHYTSEIVLRAAGGIAGLLFAASLFLFGGRRWRIDAVGITCTRGVAPLFPFTVPPEAVRRALVRESHHMQKSRPVLHAGYHVTLELKAPARLGPFDRQDEIHTESFSVPSSDWVTVSGRLTHASPAKLAATRVDARALAERFRVLLSLEPTHEEVGWRRRGAPRPR